MAYATIQDIRKDFEAAGLIGKHLSEVLLTHNHLYHRVYAFAKREGKDLRKLWEEVGLLKSYSLVSNHDELVTWAAKHKIIGKRLCDIKENHISKLYRYAKDANVAIEIIYKTLGIDTEYKIVYKSIEDIRQDLIQKGLVGKSPEDITVYDGNVTYSNIRRFADRQHINIFTLYKIVGIRYSDKTEVVDGVVKAARIYKSIEDIETDLQSKGLVGKTIRDVVQYDCTATYALVLKFARRADMNPTDLWKELGVLPSGKSLGPDVPMFSSIEQIKSWLEEEAIGSDLGQFRVHHKKAYCKILEFAKKEGMVRGAIWKELGLESDITVINSIEEVAALLSKHDLRNETVKTIRIHKRGTVYQAIYSFSLKNKISLKVLWKVLGIKREYNTKRYRSDPSKNGSC
ncbi:MAG: hypothetical protein IT284_00165 [Bacteroidetes bacterium]|nr:hypothetical protein [Bacteroidota bacterium]